MLNSRFALLGNEFYTKDEELVDFNYVTSAKDFIAIYFGGLHNPGSVKFTDFLSMFYYEINASEKLVEVIYVSFDRNYKEFRKHMESMPWVTLPYHDYRTKKLKFVFNATEIPKLVFLRVKDGTIASDDGTDLV
jgi:nucleoredoxin